MKVLSVGTGVIGLTYLWKLSEAGCETRVLVREEKYQHIRDHGMIIDYTDKRGKERKTGKLTFKPACFTIQNVPDDNDIIIISVNSHQLASVLELVSTFEKGLFLIFQNTWKCREQVGNFLHSPRYLLGLPHMVGGRNLGTGIETIIFGDGATRIEYPDTDDKKILLKPLEDALSKAGMKPKRTKNMEGWIVTHHIQQTSGIGPFLKYGGPEAVLSQNDRIREMILTTREGLKVCKEMGYNPLYITPIIILYLPLFLLVPLFRKMFADEDELRMVNGHFSHGKEEMINGWKEVLETGKKYKISMPRWGSYAKYMNS